MKQISIPAMILYDTHDDDNDGEISFRVLHHV